MGSPVTTSFWDIETSGQSESNGGICIIRSNVLYQPHTLVGDDQLGALETSLLEIGHEATPSVMHALLNQAESRAASAK